MTITDEDQDILMKLNFTEHPNKSDDKIKDHI